jgi:hypothetical protein
LTFWPPRKTVVVSSSRVLELPALALAARLAPALGLVLLGSAGGRLAPLVDHLALEYRALGDIDQRVDGAGVVDLVVRDGRGVGDARAGVGEHLVFEGGLGMPEPSSSDMRVYWLPIRPLMFSHLGWAGSAGGLRGSKAMWQEPQEVPIRKGGSIEASASLLTRLSDSMPVTLSMVG